MPTGDRKLEVLRAIVEDFIATNEPVGSKALADRHNLGVSPATIRKVVDELVESGRVAKLGPVPGWSGPGRPPTQYELR